MVVTQSFFRFHQRSGQYNLCLLYTSLFQEYHYRFCPFQRTISRHCSQPAQISGRCTCCLLYTSSSLHSNNQAVVFLAYACIFQCFTQERGICIDTQLTQYHLCLLYTSDNQVNHVDVRSINQIAQTFCRYSEMNVFTCSVEYARSVSYTHLQRAQPAYGVFFPSSLVSFFLG